MSLLDQQVRRARRRLTGIAFIEHLSHGILGAGGLWAAGVVLVRLAAWDMPLWHGAWLAPTLALFFAAAATAWTRPGTLNAALVLDAAAGLKERLSTALTVRRVTDPFAQAAVSDAERAAGRVHVPTQIRYRAPTLWPWSLATACAAVILAAFLPPMDVFGRDRRVERTVPLAELEAEHSAIQAELDSRLNALKELARDNPNLKDLAEELTPLEPPRTPGLTPEDLRREAVKRIDAVGDKLRRELESAENNPLAAMKRMLEKLPTGSGRQPDSRLAQALAGGDFQGARQALQEMQEQMQAAAEKADDPAARQQLDEMRQQLERLAEQIARLDDSLQMQKELENRAGLTEEQARELLDELARLSPDQLEKELQNRLGDTRLTPEQIRELARQIRENQQAREACRRLSNALNQAAGACQASSAPAGGASSAGQAAAALDSAAALLSELEMAQQMLSDLEAQLSDLDNLRDSVCQGNCRRPGRGGRGGIGMQGPQYGLGYGSRIGQEATPYQRDPTKARTRFQGGTVIGRMLVDGPQVPGAATAETRQAAAAEVRDALDAIEREEVPQQYRKALREYFDRLAGVMRDAPPGEQSESKTPEGAGR